MRAAALLIFANVISTVLSQWGGLNGLERAGSSIAGQIEGLLEGSRLGIPPGSDQWQSGQWGGGQWGFPQGGSKWGGDQWGGGQWGQGRWGFPQGGERRGGQWVVPRGRSPSRGRQRAVQTGGSQKRRSKSRHGRRRFQMAMFPATGGSKRKI
ncbi:hypothetical protein V3C99_013786 [Haemonchus contortus]|uniref:Glycine rich superfamily member n=1 Tax=Haemonchus contortus TaxID=6289 RepID=A0A7I4Z4L8_HAECO